MSETWDLYDINRIKTLKTAQRGPFIENGYFHMVVHVCIFNKDGHMLIQQRQKDKVGFPNHFDVTCGGSAIAGEDSRTAVRRELYEELGIDIDFKDERPFLTVNFSHGFDDFYLIEKDIPLNDLILDPNEVQSARYASLEDILMMIDAGTFVPYHKSLIQCLFDMKNQRGALTRSFF
jgi:isopentenyldiphosphate isomerase